MGGLLACVALIAPSTARAELPCGTVGAIPAITASVNVPVDAPIGTFACLPLEESLEALTIDWGAGTVTPGRVEYATHPGSEYRSAAAYGSHAYATANCRQGLDYDFPYITAITAVRSSDGAAVSGQGSVVRVLGLAKPVAGDTRDRVTLTSPADKLTLRGTGCGPTPPGVVSCNAAGPPPGPPLAIARAGDTLRVTLNGPASAVSARLRQGSTGPLVGEERAWRAIGTSGPCGSWTPTRA
jgi:hypothetical protein